MWELTSGKGKQWGLESYEAPRRYLDSKKIKKEKENMLIANKKKKRPK